MAWVYLAPLLAAAAALLAVVFFPGPEESGPGEFDRLDERPYAAIAAEERAAAAAAAGDGAASSAGEGPHALTRVTDGVFELIAPQPDKLHQKCFPLFSQSSNRSMTAKAKALDVRWREGNLSAPCVWSQRMTVVALDKGVLLYNPVEYTEERAAAVRALGDVRFLVLPNFEHAINFEFESWRRAFPDTMVVTVSGTKMVNVLRELPKSKMLLLSSSLKAPPKVQKLLKDFDIVVVGMAALEDEILLHHRPSKSLLVADFVFFASADKEDPGGWPRLSSPKWTHLYYWFHTRFTPYLLPVYRMAYTPKQKAMLMEKLEKVLELRAERVLSAHAGRVSTEGAEHTAELLRKTWRWCNVSKKRR